MTQNPRRGAARRTPAPRALPPSQPPASVLMESLLTGAQTPMTVISTEGVYNSADSCLDFEHTFRCDRTEAYLLIFPHCFGFEHPGGRFTFDVDGHPLFSDSPVEDVLQCPIDEKIVLDKALFRALDAGTKKPFGLFVPAGGRVKGFWEGLKVYGSSLTLRYHRYRAEGT